MKEMKRGTKEWITKRTNGFCVTQEMNKINRYLGQTVNKKMYAQQKSSHPVGYARICSFF